MAIIFGENKKEEKRHIITENPCNIILTSPFSLFLFISSLDNSNLMIPRLGEGKEGTGGGEFEKDEQKEEKEEKDEKENEGFEKGAREGEEGCSKLN